MPEPSAPAVRPPHCSHHLAGWLLIGATLLAAILPVALRFTSAWVAEATGRAEAEVSTWWSIGGFVLLALVALAVGGRFAFERTGPKPPSAAKRAATAGNTLVEIEPLPSPAEAGATETSSPAAARAAKAAAEAPAYWPAEQAVGVAWARAADAVHANTASPAAAGANAGAPNLPPGTGAHEA
jgi:membrane protein implicated in regulation of membrane protease activity